jgi:hypothetical protein
MAHFYFATSQKPTAVGQAAVGAFTGPNDVNLALGKTTRLEIHRYTAEGLELVLDIAVNGRIANMKMIRINVSSCNGRAAPAASAAGLCSRSDGRARALNRAPSYSRAGPDGGLPRRRNRTTAADGAEV